MKVIAKIGRHTKVLDGLSASLIRKKMEGVMKEHTHLCSDCVSFACGHHRGINSVMVYSGIRTLNRDYIFGCRGYKKRKSGEGFEHPLSINHPNTYQPTIYTVCDPEVKDKVKYLK